MAFTGRADIRAGTTENSVAASGGGGGGGDIEKVQGHAGIGRVPVFEGLTEQKFMDSSPDEMAGSCDVIFSALPHGVAMDFVPHFLKCGAKKS